MELLSVGSGRDDDVVVMRVVRMKDYFGNEVWLVGRVKIASEVGKR